MCSEIRLCHAFSTRYPHFLLQIDLRDPRTGEVKMKHSINGPIANAFVSDDQLVVVSTDGNGLYYNFQITLKIYSSLINSFFKHNFATFGSN